MTEILVGIYYDNVIDGVRMVKRKQNLIFSNFAELIVKLREREGQRLDLWSLSLKGHL